MSQKEVKISKTLSSILRHNIVKLGIKCDNQGFVKVSDLFTRKLVTCNMDELIRVVNNSDKQRFVLENRNGEYYIKANQGHSKEVGDLIEDETALLPITEPLPFCAHGTEKRFLSSIREHGLKRMSRKHIHMVSEVCKKQQISGFKSVSDTIIVIDMNSCMKDGMKFYKSKNGVILTEGIDGTIDPKYFLEIRNL